MEKSEKKTWIPMKKQDFSNRFPKTMTKMEICEKTDRFLGDSKEISNRFPKDSVFLETCEKKAEEQAPVRGFSSTFLSSKRFLEICWNRGELRMMKIQFEGRGYAWRLSSFKKELRIT